MRPAATFGQFGRTVIESVFVQDVIVGGSVAVVRAGSSFARGLQTGYLRSYAVAARRAASPASASTS